MSCYREHRPRGLRVLAAMLVVIAAWVTVPVLHPAVAELVLWEVESRPGSLREAWVRDLVRFERPHGLTRTTTRAAAPAAFTIAPGETAAKVAGRLAEAGLIGRPVDLLLPLYERRAADALQAGTYRIPPRATAEQLAAMFQRAEGTALTLRVIEGWRLTQIAETVSTTFPAISAEAFLAAAKAGPYEHPVLKALPAGTPLEGYLFPDTYFFSADAKAADIVRTLLDTFEARAGETLRAAAERLKVSMHDLVTIASIVEREARKHEEAPLVASVYWNRIARKMPLEADPTVQYAKGTWAEPTPEDLAVESPYNTYRVAGLPPTPIASPGLVALRASAAPAPSAFLFFVARGDGSGLHFFAATAQEHEANVAKYLANRAKQP